MTDLLDNVQKPKHCYTALFLDSLLFFPQMAQSPCLDCWLYVAYV